MANWGGRSRFGQQKRQNSIQGPRGMCETTGQDATEDWAKRRDGIFLRDVSIVEDQEPVLLFLVSFFSSREHALALVKSAVMVMQVVSPSSPKKQHRQLNRDTPTI